MKKEISYKNFEDIDIRVGTVISAIQNNLLNKPSMVLKIDFGENIGIKKSSAQLTENYSEKELINKQVVAVINFKPKQIGNILSEVLVLGFADSKNQPILITPDLKIKNGKKLY
tara:strand:+ start:12140 stop:12481 length:342 start_codon:yes stop_codon:yes gene_type:complete